MILGSGVRIFLAIEPVDGRKSFDTLCQVVRDGLGQDPLCGDLFVFRNRDATRAKVLFWDHNGLVIYAKRIERGTFRFPACNQSSLTVTSSELVELLAAKPRAEERGVRAALRQAQDPRQRKEG